MSFAQFFSFINGVFPTGRFENAIFFFLGCFVMFDIIHILFSGVTSFISKR